MSSSTYRELASSFFRLGAISFGGPIALISLMEEEFCRRKKSISQEEFHETFVLTKLFPGPIAYQMAVWIGHHLRGRWGGVLAGIAFLVPGFVLILALTYLYSTVMGWAYFPLIMEGMRAGALVIILDSVTQMSRPYLERVAFFFLAAIGIAAMFMIPRWEPLLILIGGASAVVLSRVKRTTTLQSFSPLLLWHLFWLHFKGGAFVFGTGLAIVPYLEHEVVSVFQWLTHDEFLDGIAFGQITPGPVTITSAFIGFKAAGFWGAISAVTGMYLPGTLLILFFLPFLKRRLHVFHWLSTFQVGAISMVIGCILGASIKLGLESITTIASGIVFSLCLGFLYWKKPAAWVLIPIGSAFRLILSPFF